MNRLPPRLSITRWTMLLCTYLLVAAAAFCGMYAKHGFGDDTVNMSLAAALDGTALRPYVYRQLLPEVANVAEALLPRAAKTRFLDHLAKDAPAHNPLRATFARSLGSDDPAHALRYYIVYSLSFCSLLAAMLILRLVCIDLTGDEAAATLAPLVLAIVVPATYYYDFPELFFMALAVWLACRAKLFWLVPLAAVATLNKESFPVFVLTLYPFLRLRASRRSAVTAIGACLVAGALVNALIKYRYAANAGAPAYFNLWVNFHFYADPRNYFLSDWMYGIPLPRPTNVIVLVMLALLVRAGWRALPACVRQHALIAVALNVPLFLALGFIDEVRALSMLDVSATLLLCAVASRYLARAGHTRTAITTAPATAIEAKRGAALQGAARQGPKAGATTGAQALP